MKADIVALDAVNAELVRLERLNQCEPWKVLGLENIEADPDDDYVICNEIHVEPISLAKARIELWFADNGAIGLGFERTSRLARRTGLETSVETFAAGFEPSFITAKEIIEYLQLISLGGVFLRRKGAGKLRLSSLEACTTVRAFSQVVSQTAQTSSPRWLSILQDEVPPPDALTFLPWGS